MTIGMLQFGCAAGSAMRSPSKSCASTPSTLGPPAGDASLDSIVEGASAPSGPRPHPAPFFQGQYSRGEAEGNLLGTQYIRAYSVIPPPRLWRLERTRIGRKLSTLSVTGRLKTTSIGGRTGWRTSASSSDAITAAGEAKKAVDYRRTVHAAWALAFSEVPCPGSGADSRLPPGGLDEMSGLYFESAVFDTFGGCSENTTELVKMYVQRVADLQGSTLNRVFQ